MKARMKDTLGNRYALMHMIGQLVDMEMLPITTGVLQSFMGVSKPTAINRLDQLVKEGLLHKERAMYRNSQLCFYWSLTNDCYRKYRNGLYEQHYKFYITIKAQIAAMKPHNKVMSV